MSNPSYNRKEFLAMVSIAGLATTVAGGFHAFALNTKPGGKRIGIIGLDVSHSVAFTKLLNAPDVGLEFSTYRVVAAFPGGSTDIEASISRVAEFSRQVEESGVTIVSTIKDLLKMVDVVMINSNDGRLHYQQALQCFKAGKLTFIDKPFGASLSDVLSVFEASHKYRTPVFSSSSMRYFENEQALSPRNTGRILGAFTFSPATLEKTHSDLFWYGIHGVEMLYKVMGKGCQQVSGVFNADTDIVTGTWPEGRLGTFHGNRKGPHGYGGTVFGEKEIVNIVPAKGFRALLKQIIVFFEQGISPLDPSETIEIYTFMEAAAESKRKNGAVVRLDEILKQAQLNSGK